MSTDPDTLPPTQYLVLEVLAARYRCGEYLWTFPSRCRPAIRALARAGLVHEMHGIVPNTVRAWLSDEGKALVLVDGYTPPVEEARSLVYQFAKQIMVSRELVCWPRDFGEEPMWFSGYEAAERRMGLDPG